MNSVVEFKEPELPAAVSRRKIDESQWRTLMNNLYPGAKGESVLMVWDYCAARKLDPLKKPCHIVPMKVGDSWRDVVMPGIYEYRITARRTGEYMGHSEPEFGPEIEYLGVQVPSYCKLTVYRWNEKAKEKCAYPAKAKFAECAGTAWDKKAECIKLNSRWTKAPEQMIEKCAEAAALRKAFPDELGGEHTAEEMEGLHVELEEESVGTRALRASRAQNAWTDDLVDWEECGKHVSSIADLIAEYGSDETQIALRISEYCEAHLNAFPELFIAVNNKLASDGIIKKSTFRAYAHGKAP